MNSHRYLFPDATSEFDGGGHGEWPRGQSVLGKIYYNTIFYFSKVSSMVVQNSKYNFK